MLNNHSKSSNNSEQPQMVAGLLQNDSNIEFVAIEGKKESIWLQNGTAHYFTDLPIHIYTALSDFYLTKPKAVSFLKGVTNNHRKQVELFVFYYYGDLDNAPDVVIGPDGTLTFSEAENFRETENCPSLLWEKDITIDGNALTSREIALADLIGKGLPDKAIAAYFNILPNSLDPIKRKLYNKAGVNNKSEFAMKALLQKVIRHGC